MSRYSRSLFKYPQAEIDFLHEVGASKYLSLIGYCALGALALMLLVALPIAIMDRLGARRWKDELNAAFIEAGVDPSMVELEVKIVTDYFCGPYRGAVFVFPLLAYRARLWVSPASATSNGDIITPPYTHLCLPVRWEGDIVVLSKKNGRHFDWTLKDLFRIFIQPPLLSGDAAFDADFKVLSASADSAAAFIAQPEKRRLLRNLLDLGCGNFEIVGGWTRMSWPGKPEENPKMIPSVAALVKAAGLYP